MRTAVCVSVAQLKCVLYAYNGTYTGKLTSILFDIKAAHHKQGTEEQKGQDFYSKERLTQ